MRIFPLILVLLSVSIFCRSQICTGSLGDPVVNISFGSGAGGPVPASTTSLSYTSNLCPSDGGYTVVNSSVGCWSSTWHSLGEDHTPNDNGGLMMLINASFNPGDFYIETVNGLCENSTYEFSAWILNILKTTACNGNGIEPNLTFNIETTAGVSLGKYETGRIPQSGAPQWKQYGLFFKTPAGISSVVIRITNNAPGGCGNDIVLDDILFRPCGPTVSAAFVSGTGSASIDICDTDVSDYQLRGIVSTGYAQPAFQWQVSKNDGKWEDIPGAVSAEYTRKHSSAGNYKYRLAISEGGNINQSNCRVVSNLITINVNEKPAINLTSNSPLCDGMSLIFQANAVGTIYWTGPDGVTLDALPLLIASEAIEGTYYATAITAAGCVNKDSVNVIVNRNPKAVVSGDAVICEGSSTRLTASGGTGFQWSPVTGLSAGNIANPVASPAQTTRFTATVKNQEGCQDTSSVLIQVNSRPTANAGADKTITQGESVTLDGAVSGTGVSYYWTPSTNISNVNALSPVVNPPADRIFSLHAVSNAGCGTAVDNVFVRVFRKVIIPNVFSPNGDGINDEWKIEALEGYPEANISVFNRYGQQVYVSRGYSRPWNGNAQGKPLPAASYYYVIDLKNNFPVLTGWVMIIR